MTDHQAEVAGEFEPGSPFADRDHIVVGIGNDEHGPFWSTLGQNLAPVTLESARKSRDWFKEQQPNWDVRIYRIEEVD